jgi:DNA-binding PadR family transcriptional regulator
MNQGMVEDAPRRSADDDPRRRYYRLTEFGRRILAAEVARLEDLVREAKSHLRAPNPRRAT